jgi:DNA mismatch endonuclease (patch repair protein)
LLPARRRDTAPELAVRRAVHRHGLRFRVDRAPIAGSRRRADLLFPREKVAVFVDGCFWHRCAQHASWPKVNSAWWRKKLDANVERDVDTTRLLRSHGWRVIRVWAHDPPITAATKVRRIVLAARLAILTVG